MEMRDELLGRIRAPGAIWAETPDDREASRLRDRARRYLNGDGKLERQDLERMVALLFLRRA